MKKVLFTLALVALMLPLGAQNITTFPWLEGFEGTEPAGFTFIDSDGDGYGWDLSSWSGAGRGFNESDGLIASASYINSIGALTPDNWMILPAIELPTGTSYNLTWYDADYNYAETYSVYITTAGNTVADFTATTGTSYTTVGEALVYTKRTIDLSSYAGQTIYVAFRHFNVTDNYWLFIDNIRVGGPEAPIVNISGPTTAMVNDEVTFTANSTDANATFAWTVDGSAMSSTTSTLTTSFAEAGIHNISVVATNNVGPSDPANFSITIISCDPVTTLPWEEGFEGSGDCWVFHNLSSDNGFHFATANPLYGLNSHSGDGLLFGAYNDDEDANQWAISPLITIPAEGAHMNFWLSATEYEGIQTHYEIRVSNGGTEVADFTNLVREETTSTMGDSYEYAERTVSLADFAGQTIRIAIHNMTGQGGDCMMVDDITIASGVGIEEVNNKVNVEVYPNPVLDLLNVNGKNIKMVEVIDMNGRTVLTSERAGRINMSTLSEGVYMVRVTTGKGVATEKIVKK